MIMTNEVFYQYCKDISLPPIGITLLKEIREGHPVRETKPNRYNEVGQLVSPKVGLSTQRESKSTEHQNAMRLKHASEVIEYCDQPYPFTYRGYDKKGKRRKKYYTPDYISLESDKVIVSDTTSYSNNYTSTPRNFKKVDNATLFNAFRHPRSRRYQRS